MANIGIGVEQKVDLLFKKFFNLKSHTTKGSVEVSADFEPVTSFASTTTEQVWADAFYLPIDRNPLNPGSGNWDGSGFPAVGQDGTRNALIVPATTDPFFTAGEAMYLYNINIDMSFALGLPASNSDNFIKDSVNRKNVFFGSITNPLDPSGPNITENINSIPYQTKNYLTEIPDHPHSIEQYLPSGTLSPSSGYSGTVETLTGVYDAPRLVYSINDGGTEHPIYERLCIPLTYVKDSVGTWTYDWASDELNLLDDQIYPERSTIIGRSQVITNSFRPDSALTSKSNGANLLYNYIIGWNESHSEGLKGVFKKFVAPSSTAASGNWFFDNDALRLNIFSIDDPASGGFAEFFGGAANYVFKYNTAPNPLDPPFTADQTVGYVSTEGLQGSTKPGLADILYVMCYRYIGRKGGAGGGGVIPTVTIDSVKALLAYVDDTTLEPTLGNSTTLEDKINYISGTLSNLYIYPEDNVAGITSSNGAGLTAGNIYWYDTDLTSWVNDPKLDPTDPEAADGKCNFVDDFIVRPGLETDAEFVISTGVGATPSGTQSVDGGTIIRYTTDFTGDGFPDSWYIEIPTVGNETFIVCDGVKSEWSGNGWEEVFVQETYCINETVTANNTYVDFDVASNEQVSYAPIAGCLEASVNGVHIDTGVNAGYRFGPLVDDGALTSLGVGTVSYNVNNGVAPINDPLNEIYGTFDIAGAEESIVSSSTGYVQFDGSEFRKVISKTDLGGGLTFSIAYSGPQIAFSTVNHHTNSILRGLGDVIKDDYMFWKANRGATELDRFYELDQNDTIKWIYDSTENPNP